MKTSGRSGSESYRENVPAPTCWFVELPQQRTARASVIAQQWSMPHDTLVAPKDAGVFLRRYRKLAQARKEMRGDMNPRPLLELAERLEAITHDADADQSDAGPVRRQAKALKH